MTRKSQSLLNVIFWIYILALVYLLFFSEAMGRHSGAQGYHYNLVPFLEIKRFVVYWNKVGASAAFINIIGNVIAFLPYGLLLPMISKKSHGFIRVTLWTLEFSLLMEMLQLFTKVGSFDVDDLFLNTLGGCVGYMLYYVLYKRRKKHEKKY